DLEATETCVFARVLWRTASRGVMIDRVGERRDAAIVHVGCGDRDVAQRRRLELARLIRGERGVVIQAVAEVEAVVAAMTAGDGVGEEDDFSALGSFGDGIAFTTVVVAIVWRTRGDDRALESGDRLRGVLDGVCAERLWPKRTVNGIGAQHCEERVFMP